VRKMDDYMYPLFFSDMKPRQFNRLSTFKLDELKEKKKKRKEDREARKKEIEEKKAAKEERKRQKEERRQQMEDDKKMKEEIKKKHPVIQGIIKDKMKAKKVKDPEQKKKNKEPTTKELHKMAIDSVFKSVKADYKEDSDEDTPVVSSMKRYGFDPIIKVTEDDIIKMEESFFSQKLEYPLPKEKYQKMLDEPIIISDSEDDYMEEEPDEETILRNWKNFKST
jgi:hypothetical protein